VIAKRGRHRFRFLKLSVRSAPTERGLKSGDYMATWREVVGYLKSNYKISSEEGTTLALNFETENGRSQMIFASGIAIDDPSIATVLFASPFATRNSITTQQLLACMEESFLGVGLAGDLYVFRHHVPMANLDANEIEWPLIFVTLAADGMEKKLGLGDNF